MKLVDNFKRDMAILNTAILIAIALLVSMAVAYWLGSLAR